MEGRNSEGFNLASLPVFIGKMKLVNKPQTFSFSDNTLHKFSGRPGKEKEGVTLFKPVPQKMRAKISLIFLGKGAIKVIDVKVPVRNGGIGMVRLLKIQRVSSFSCLLE